MGWYYSDEYLEHHGIKGQKWGIRRFQNLDGTRIKSGKADWGNYDVGADFKSSAGKRADLPDSVMKMAVNKNPFNRTDNCKEVAHAFCESMYSNDPKVISGRKPRFPGNLYDYATEKLGFAEKYVITSNGSNGEELRNRTIDRINNRYQDGDYGMIGFNGDPKRVNHLKELGLLDENATGIDGHCFNWIKIDGEVKFFDCAPAGGPYDANVYFDKADYSKDAELVCYNKAKSGQ